MHVKIEDHDAADGTLGQEAMRGHGKIIEDAIARTGLGKSVMATARAVCGIALLQRQSRSKPRTAD